MGREKVSMTPLARDAALALGQQVRSARASRRITAAELAARSGVSPRTVSAIERGDAAVSIGNVFNVAAAAGVPLFGAETEAELEQLRRVGEDRAALLPVRVRSRKAPAVDADF